MRQLYLHVGLHEDRHHLPAGGCSSGTARCSPRPGLGLGPLHAPVPAARTMPIFATHRGARAPRRSSPPPRPARARGSCLGNEGLSTTCCAGRGRPELRRGARAPPPHGTSTAHVVIVRPPPGLPQGEPLTPRRSRARIAGDHPRRSATTTSITPAKLARLEAIFGARPRACRRSTATRSRTTSSRPPRRAGPTSIRHARPGRARRTPRCTGASLLFLAGKCRSRPRPST